MPLTGVVHVSFALAAIVLGAIVVVRPKGTQPHRLVGYGYVVAMLGVNGTALIIYRLFGTFGPFHYAAAASLLTLAAGLAAVMRKRPKKRWLDVHARLMAWSYAGLLAAFVAETMSRVPESPFWGMVLGATVAVLLVGNAVINRGVPRAIRNLRRA